ncbi:MAG: hypothetical protein ABFD03_04090 [Clostridiaceae bacterium]
MTATKTRTRAETFFLIISGAYLLVASAMIGLALYRLTGENVTLSIGGVTDAVFAIIGGVIGFVAGVFGLVSKQMKRCRLMGLVLLLIALVPLAINLLAGKTFAVYWKNILLMVMPFLYLVGSLLKRSAKQKPIAAPPAQPEQPVETSPKNL